MANSSNYPLYRRYAFSTLYQQKTIEFYRVWVVAIYMTENILAYSTNMFGPIEQEPERMMQIFFLGKHIRYKVGSKCWIKMNVFIF